MQILAKNVMWKFTDIPYHVRFTHFLFGVSTAQCKTVLATFVTSITIDNRLEIALTIPFHMTTICYFLRYSVMKRSLTKRQ